ncbi:MAG TPA: hypothetical protein VL098_00970 [Flavipsychrobacter sp.]|nr:hypothetical protein [Flavipsychrobacter sp.]
MQLWKTTFITVCAFLGVTSTMLYTSCEQDPCLDLKCEHGGSCAEGLCRCKVGYEGAECEIMAADKFLGLYVGERACDGLTPIRDSVIIFLDKYPNKVKLVQTSRINDTLSGTTGDLTTEGYSIQFDDYSRENYRRYSRAVLSRNGFKNLTVFNQVVEDVTVSTDKKICDFIGRK